MHDVFTSLLLMGVLGSGPSTPFWAVSNQYGLVPETPGAWSVLSVAKPGDEDAPLGCAWGASAALQARPERCDVLLDELYFTLRHKRLALTAGMRHRTREFFGADVRLGSLSTSGGHLAESGNARTMPGLALSVDSAALPLTRGRLRVSALYGDYQTIDNRCMDGALVHRLRLLLHCNISKTVYIQGGLDHYTLWGGRGADGRTMQVTWSNYWRVVRGRPAGEEGTLNDRLNVLGDHGGAEQLRLGVRGTASEVVFQVEKPYSDHSSMEVRNLPDGLYTLHWSRDDKTGWVSDVLVEYMYTMWQSGTIHEPEADADGQPFHNGVRRIVTGNDNYFCNGEYLSGWTAFGRVMASPLFTTGPQNGVTMVVNNRIKAYHTALSGRLAHAVPYRIMCTYSLNYGTYQHPFVGESTLGSGWKWYQRNRTDKPLRQLSVALNTCIAPQDLCRRLKWPATFETGLYWDCGELLSRTVGCTFGVRYNL